MSCFKHITIFLDRRWRCHCFYPLAKIMSCFKHITIFLDRRWCCYCFMTTQNIAKNWRQNGYCHATGLFLLSCLLWVLFLRFLLNAKICNHQNTDSVAYFASSSWWCYSKTRVGVMTAYWFQEVWQSQFYRRSFDSSVGRAEDCRVKIVILRSLVRIRLEGKFLFFLSSFKNYLS